MIRQKDQRMVISFNRWGMRLTSAMLFALLSLVGCATPIPVQEMSNARQSIQAAQQAQARDLASESLARAEALLESATKQLDKGDFDMARQLAMEAQQMAIRARNEAISQHRQ